MGSGSATYLTLRSSQVIMEEQLVLKTPHQYRQARVDLEDPWRINVDREVKSVSSIYLSSCELSKSETVLKLMLTNMSNMETSK